MKTYTPRQLAIIGAIGMAVIAAIVLGVLQYNRLPIFTA